MRYAAALSLSSELRAGVVEPLEIEAEVARVTACLQGWSPSVEPAPREPGVFWLDVSGLRPLYPSYEQWVAEVRRDLSDTGYYAAVAVGYSRFGSYAIARFEGGGGVLPSADEEQRRMRAVPLDRLSFPPKVRDALAQLGVRHLGSFLDLPPDGVRRRFGAETWELYSTALGEQSVPFQAEPHAESFERQVVLDASEENLDRILAHVELLLRGLVARLRERREAVAEVRLRFGLDRVSRRDGNDPTYETTLTPAEPTADEVRLLRLLRLRLEEESFTAGVIEIRLEVIGVAGSAHQLTLFRDDSARDRRAAERALAEVRASFGDDSVLEARIEDGHLPEARFGWHLFECLSSPRPKPCEVRPLVRRVFTPSLPLPPRPRHEPDGWFVHRFEDGPVDEVVGPQVISGGWWMRETHRSYHFVRTRNGRWFWIYRDRDDRRWFLQGEVE